MRSLYRASGLVQGR